MFGPQNTGGFCCARTAVASRVIIFCDAILRAFPFLGKKHRVGLSGGDR